MNNQNKQQGNIYHKWIRGKVHYAVAIAVVLVTAYYFLLFDSHLASLIEAYATNLNRAQVNIGDLKTHSRRGLITLSNIQIANEADPIKNLLEVDSLRITLSLRPLLQRKLIIEKLEVDGIRYNTERRSSGATSNETLSQTVPGILHRSLANFYSQARVELGDNPLKTLGELFAGVDIGTKVTASKQELKSVRAIALLKAEIEKTEASWKDTLNKMPLADEIIKTQDKMALLKEELKQKQYSESEVNEKLNDLQGKITSDHRRATNLWEQMTESSLSVQSEFDKTSSLLDKDVTLLKNQLRLPSLNHKDLTTALFGPLLIRYLERVSYWIDLSRRRMPIASLSGSGITKTQYGVGSVSYHYLKATSLPVFLIKEAQFSSNSNASDPSLIDVLAHFESVTSDPVIYGKPFKFKMSFNNKPIGLQQVQLEGQIDHSGQNSEGQVEKFKLQIAALPLRNVMINDVGDVHLSIESGSASINGTLDFTEANLQANAEISAYNIHFQANSRFKEIQNVVESSLSRVPNFVIQTKVSGITNKLNFTSNSDLGQVLASDLRNQFKHQIGAIDDDLRKNILDEIYPVRQALLERFRESRAEAFKSAQSRLKPLQELVMQSDREIAQLKTKSIKLQKGNSQKAQVIH